MDQGTRLSQLILSGTKSWQPLKISAKIRLPVGRAGAFTAESRLSLWGGWGSGDPRQASHRGDAGAACVCRLGVLRWWGAWLEVVGWKRCAANCRIRLPHSPSELASHFT